MRSWFLNFQTQASLPPLLIHKPSDLLFSHLWNGYSDYYTVDSKEEMSDPSTMVGS